MLVDKDESISLFGELNSSSFFLQNLAKRFVVLKTKIS